MNWRSLSVTHSRGRTLSTSSTSPEANWDFSPSPIVSPTDECASPASFFSHFFFVPLLRSPRSTATTVINWCSVSLHTYLLRVVAHLLAPRFFLSLFLFVNRPTFVNSLVLRRPRRWWRRRWLPASSYFPPDSGFPAAGTSIRRPVWCDIRPLKKNHTHIETYYVIVRINMIYKWFIF